MSSLKVKYLPALIGCLFGHAHASDFNLPFVNSSSLGVAYADFASATNDASVAFTNPGALFNIQNAELVYNALGIIGRARYTGSSISPNFPYPTPTIETGRASSDIQAILPSFYFSAPFNDRFYLAVHSTTPFGLGTDYGDESLVRYAATFSKVVGMDMGPDVGFKVTDYFGIGAGLDAMRLSFTLNSMLGAPFSPNGDSRVVNHLVGWGLTWHAGFWVRFDEQTRFGFSYHDKVKITASGRNQIIFPNGQELRTDSQQGIATLPGRAQVSIEEDLTPIWTVMATAFYTNWRAFDQLALTNTLAADGSTMQVFIPFNYRDTWDLSFGTSYQLKDDIKLRAGYQWVDVPSNDQNRGVANPVGGANIFTLGGQYRYSEALVFDVGVGHALFHNSFVNYSNPLVKLNGKVRAHTTSMGAQITWNMI